jgi:hypothetical protein
MNRLYLVLALGVLGLALAAPARAQFGVNRPAYADEAQPYFEARRVAHDNGYREGLKEGERDARRRDTFNYQDERTWQRADKGYHRSFGDFVRYQQSFRSGYGAGYADAYRRFAPNYGYGGYGRAVPQQRGYPGYPGQYPSYPGSSNYPGQYPGRSDYGYSPAFANGTNDGYAKGLEDARDRDSYDPNRHKWFRSGDRNYRNEYGPKQQYINLYRQGFREGYDRGYRSAGYGRY